MGNARGLGDENHRQLANLVTKFGVKSYLGQIKSRSSRIKINEVTIGLLQGTFQNPPDGESFSESLHSLRSNRRVYKTTCSSISSGLVNLIKTHFSLQQNPCRRPSFVNDRHIGRPVTLFYLWITLCRVEDDRKTYALRREQFDTSLAA